MWFVVLHFVSCNPPEPNPTRFQSQLVCLYTEFPHVALDPTLNSYDSKNIPHAVWLVSARANILCSGSLLGLKVLSEFHRRKAGF